ncbi:uncharacterized protein ACO6RY_03356 [Pungitius sinensis]
MAELCLKDGMFILVFSLLFACSAAQRDYFVPNAEYLTWYEARNYCQVHFKELATVTPENIKTITQNLSSASWIGLRRNFSDAVSSSAFWSRWADEEHLLFQNWYPGSPVLQKSANCPAAAAATTTSTTTSSTQFTSSNMMSSDGFPNMTDPTVASSSGPAAVTEGVEDAGGYVEDSCVAMLSFGAWVERSCSERLSFVCYEDRFPGRVNVTGLTSQSAVLTWLPFPGTIDRYRVEVKVGGELKVNQMVTNATSLELADLTPGSLHGVRVFPVKGQREKHPQETAFYTRPNKVENLTAVQVTETSVALNWSKPVGNVELYSIESEGVETGRSQTEGTVVVNLTPGTLHTFAVLSAVNGSFTRSDESSVAAYTRPGKVCSLQVSGNTHNSVVLKWVEPMGNTTGYRVKATTASGDPLLFSGNVTQTEVNVTSLPPGTRIKLTVTALTNHDALEGDNVTIDSYTTPKPVSNLSLNATHNTLEARWSPPTAEFFTVRLLLDGVVVTEKNTTGPAATQHFDGLKAAAGYAVTVSAVVGNLSSVPVEASTFTSLVPPTNARLTSSGEDTLTFEWSAPENIAKVNYSVRLHSAFWGHDFSDVVNATSHTFSGLNSGTKYDFEVRIVANNQRSDPVFASNYTVAVEEEIVLSMMCSSAQSLLCDKTDTRKSVVKELEEHFRKHLGDSVVWELKQEPKSKG